MVLIKAGEFWYGCKGEVDKECERDEKPGRKVFLSRYSIDKFEVSASQFAHFLNEKGNPDKKYFLENDYATIVNVQGMYQPRKGYENKPANNVSWYGADAYCGWAGKRLPTEAEWEKSARGTDGRKFAWGNKPPTDYKVVYGTRFGLQKIAPVDGMEEGRSVYGLHNVAGNVLEWVTDRYDSGYYKKGESKNPKGPSSGSLRVMRGGSWYSDAIYIRASHRDAASPEDRDNRYGFRCAR